MEYVQGHKPPRNLAGDKPSSRLVPKIAGLMNPMPTWDDFGSPPQRGRLVGVDTRYVGEAFGRSCVTFAVL